MKNKKINPYQVKNTYPEGDLTKNSELFTLKKSDSSLFKIAKTARVIAYIGRVFFILVNICFFIAMIVDNHFLFAFGMLAMYFIIIIFFKFII